MQKHILLHIVIPRSLPSIIHDTSLVLWAINLLRGVVNVLGLKQVSSCTNINIEQVQVIKFTVPSLPSLSF